MATNDVQLTSGIRSNLLLLQQITGKLDRTQQRLATGNKINGAIDGPVAFFAAKGLNRRADDLSSLKDSIDQSISTIKAADTGVTSIEKMIEQAKGLVTTAYQNLGDDKNSVSLRKSLANQYNTLLRNIDKLALDSSYQGKNLLVGSGLRLDATSSSKSATNALPGITGTRVTNVVSADNYVVDVGGTGAISANASDIANAERDRGISSLDIGGFASKTDGNFDDIVIKYSGGKGKDKVFTVTEGSVSFTTTFTIAQWNAAKASGKLLNFYHQFASGTHVEFDVNFDEIDDVPDTNGVGTSVIEKFVDVNVAATNFNGLGQRIVRSGTNLLGQQKLADGENAWSFDSGVPRMTIDERSILQSASYATTIGSSYGNGGGAVTGITTASASTINRDETITLTAAGASFNYVTGNFASFTVAALGASGTSISVAGIDATTTFASFTGVGLNSNATYTLSFNLAELLNVTTAAAATAAEVNTQNTVSQITAASVATAGTSFAANVVTSVNVAITAVTATSATLTYIDQLGGTATTSVTLVGGSIAAASATATFTVAGGANSGATFAFKIDDTSAALTTATSVLQTKVRGAYTAPKQAYFDIRAAQTGFTSTINTVQVTDGSDSNNLTVQLNETNTSVVTVVSQNIQTDGQGLAIDFAQNDWLDRADIDTAARMLDAAKIHLRSSASALNNNLDIITTRLEYTKEFTDVLAEGANKLVQADQNEEGANMLQLQTRQQLGTISLSLANQAQQAILRLF